MVECAVGVLERWWEHPIGYVPGIGRLYRARVEAIELVRVVRADKVSRVNIVEWCVCGNGIHGRQTDSNTCFVVCLERA